MPNSAASSSARRWPPAFGDHIKVDRGSYEHHGIVSSHPSEPLTVIHYSKASDPPSIREEPYLTHFLFDSPASAVSIVPYDRALFSPEEVVRRARQCIGQAAYGLLSSNCEHWASWCHTDEFYSGQVAAHGSSLINVGTVGLVFGAVMVMGGVVLSRLARRSPNT